MGGRQDDCVGEEVAGKNEGADQKLCGWWDARPGRGCVTELHK